MHFAICLQPSRVPISGLELAILIFQLGRLLMEIKQTADTTQQPSEKKKLIHKALLDHFRYITFYCVYLLLIPFWPQIKSLTTNPNHTLLNITYGKSVATRLAFTLFESISCEFLSTFN